MKKLIFILLLASPIMMNQLSAQPEGGRPNDKARLYTLISDEWDFRMGEYPMWASAIGLEGYDAKIAEVGVEAEKRRARYWQNCLDKLGNINRSALDTEDQINYDFFQLVMQDYLDHYNHETYLIPISSEGGFHTGFMYSVSDRNYDSLEDYENYLKILAAFPQYCEDHLELMKLGIKKGMVASKAVLKGFDANIDPHIVDDPVDSYFYGPFVDMPEHVDAKHGNRLRSKAQSLIKKDIVPGFERIKKFVAEQYLPNASESVGVSALPKGGEFYETRVKYFTNQDISSEQVYNIGLKEVSRIRGEMEAIIKQLEFEGSFEEFLQFLRTDPQFYAKTPKDLLKEAAYICKRVEYQLPSYFGKLPRLPFGVEPVPEHLAPNYTTGRYASGNMANKKAGAYWVNTYKLESRPLYVLPALSLHEAVPGHHLQLSLAQELGEVPEFRKHTYLSSFGEGWALYAEYLGEEMGIYDDEYAQFGRLTYEMWRACRLVVDVGLHMKGWSREKAVDYLANNTALSIHNCNTEVDRYIGWPGQALSYKMGELKIKELRAKAEKEQGGNFDIRAFHDLVLSYGSVPLFALEDIVITWLEN